MIGDLDVSIVIKSGKSSITIPVIPPKINVDFGDENPQTVDIWGLGEVDFHNGTDLDRISWSSFFPARFDSGYCTGKAKNLKEPKWYRDKLEKWKTNGTELQVIITPYGVNMTAQIKAFQGYFEGQEADFYYTIEFKEKRKIPQVKVKAKKYVAKKKRKSVPVKKKAKDKKTKKKVAIKKGDKVLFKGGPVYVSSTASNRAATRKKAWCKCTIVNGNKHPYHLIHYKGDIVYGWVNASDCERL